MSLFYVRECIGKNGRPIKIRKFRTMRKDAERLFDLAVSGGFDELGKPLNDFRIIPLGRILRRYWVDETPQIPLISTGELKLVGIRPLPAEELRLYPDSVQLGYLRDGPGFIGIHYYYPDISSFKDKVKAYEDYLRRYTRNPFLTDREYFARIIERIVCECVRSR
jgi:lipopolysaccharide/colanic/teichoic acid biosynthesis glycosyltransferase